MWQRLVRDGIAPGSDKSWSVGKETCSSKRVAALLGDSRVASLLKADVDKENKQTLLR